MSALGTAVVPLFGCRPRRIRYGSPWDEILDPMPQHLAALVARPEHEVQAIYTRIDRDRALRPMLTSTPLALAPERWFSAASWVKLPAALLVAERLTRLGLDGSARIVLDQPPATGNWDQAELLDEAFERTVRRVFVVSENVPFNRLYEYLGQRELGEELAAHGFVDTRVIARLGSGDAERNRNVGGSRVRDRYGADADRREGRRNDVSPAFPFGPVLKGRGWQTDDGVVLQGPHDFSRANFIPLTAMHDMLAALVCPEAAAPSARWRLSERLRQTLLTELARWPRESSDPTYPPPEHFDGFAKFFIVGDSKANASDDVRQFSKSGQAYGYLQDCAYIVDRAAGVEFLLAATIHANADGIFNDDKYEYDEVAIPFLASLGRAVLDYERSRTRTVRPNFAGLPTTW